MKPSEVIIRALAAKARGLPYDEDEVYEATLAEAMLALMSRGVDTETAERAVLQASDNGGITVSYDGTHLSVTIGKED